MVEEFSERQVISSKWCGRVLLSAVVWELGESVAAYKLKGSDRGSRDRETANCKSRKEPQFPEGKRECRSAETI